MLLLAGCAAPAEEEGLDPAEVRQALDAVNSQFAEAFNNHDPDALVGLYSEDATLMPQGAPAAQGSEAIRQFFADLFASASPSDMTLTIQKLEIHGQVAVDVGQFSMNLNPPGQDEPVLEEGKYVVVWKQDEGGAWKLYIDIFNSNSMPPAAEESEDESE
ncbi:MAG TPA: DUF4440 domain-containing protein [Acidobacteriota bacterium]|nr:DUF4440 domain-containing protein [Acidobacteriota bacterium]